ncbi:MAG: GNAT family N-acetyltransferase [Deltaproteobacteria bacterium]|nr:GNAT family N-acetyltransferase [Deltaproteobacteria bacterium]
MTAPAFFTVRDALPFEADTLIAFNQAMASETEGRALDPAILGAGVRRLLADPALGRYFVAVDGDHQVIGQIMVTTEWSDWRCGHFYWIQSVYVAPAVRRRGVYAALHQHVVNHARMRGDVVGVRLYVEPHNERAKKTYESLGMSKTYDVMEQPL